LCADLPTGGSTQITWMISKDGIFQTSPNGSYSFPYGAAALTRKLNEAESQGHSATEHLAEEMKSNFSAAYRDLHIPESLSTKAEQEGGFTLYLSGGGFRGWGYLLLSESKISPYPVPIINGFHVGKQEFQSVSKIQNLAANVQGIFRVSKRRAAQVPAVAFLIDVLCLAMPNIKGIRFCQGGVREGFLFDSLDTETRAMDPLCAASARYGRDSAGEIAQLLLDAIPQDDRVGRRAPACFAKAVMRALADLMYEQSSSPKESASLGALYCPLTGVLASAHGVSHKDRALLALMLCQRWSGELAPPHEGLQGRLRQILTRHEVWWCNYLGKVAALVGGVYPAGTIRQSRLRFSVEWASGLGKKGLEDGIRLTVFVKEGEPMTSPGVLSDAIKEIEDVGKKKYRREEGLQDVGNRVDVQTQTFP
jgi:retrograde regulation protein 2